jgi:hypothetical protein
VKNTNLHSMLLLKFHLLPAPLRVSYIDILQNFYQHRPLHRHRTAGPQKHATPRANNSIMILVPITTSNRCGESIQNQTHAQRMKNVGSGSAHVRTYSHKWTLTAVWMARVIGETTTRSGTTPHMAAASPAARASSFPCGDRGASTSPTSTRYLCAHRQP